MPEPRLFSLSALTYRHRRLEGEIRNLLYQVYASMAMTRTLGLVRGDSAGCAAVGRLCPDRQVAAPLWVNDWLRLTEVFRLTLDTAGPYFSYGSCPCDAMAHVASESAK